MRHRDHDELAAPDDLEGVEHRHAGQHPLDALVVRAVCDAHDRVAGAGQSEPDDRTHSPGADHADAESSVPAHGPASGC